MEELGPTTKWFRGFNSGLEQSFLMASALSRAGISALNDLKALLNSITQRVANLNPEELSNLTDEERIEAGSLASELDNV